MRLMCMTSSRILVVFTLVAVMAGISLAADVTGKWTGQVPGRDGQTREVTYTFKADGETLTGSMTGFRGQDLPISDGKISGDTLSFIVKAEFGGNSMTWNHTGKIAGDEIQMKREGSRGPAREFTLKRAK